ncbi:2-amino-4-hydroxy-6-hydroxymethyldihydropteridine diphosphokinase [Tundrisphaera sp. TA3]|uniref:2-amino-4-hydroxy-6- hydroxymethyldihydropteridine diphosphokinase n=1 Tax=Tundrisphaera sp. TA3 TaxID=3435775 RepID=UPI003EB6B72C
MTRAAIGMGGNLGDRARTLDDAVAALSKTPGLIVRAVSSYHATNPTGGPGGQGAFLNAAAVVDAECGPIELLRILQGIEQAAGRVRRERWGERTLDLDLLLFGPTCLDTAELTIPHPLMPVRRFVLAPLAEIAAEEVHPPTGRTVGELLRNLDRRPARVEVLDRDEARRSRVVARLAGGIAANGWAMVVGDVPATPTTFRAVIGESRSDLPPDGTPVVRVTPGEPEAIADHLLAICQGVLGL